MTEPNRSLGIGYPLATWDDLPRWQRLVAFWALFLVATGFCVKIGQFETWFILSSGVLAGRLSSTLFELRAAGRGSERPASVAPGR